MRRSTTLLMVALLCGCSVEKAQKVEYPKSDDELSRLIANNPGLKAACRENLRQYGSPAATPMEYDECFEKMPAQRWSGLWERGWEWTSFCPAPAKECPIRADQGDIWLELAEGAYKGPELADGLYQIEFVGRRTRYPGYFGHLNQYDHLMVADRVVSIRLLKSEPHN